MKKTTIILIILLFILGGCKKETKTLNDLISELPSVEVITLADEVAIINIRNQVDSLSIEDLEKITTTNLEKLLALEEKIRTLKVAYEQAQEVLEVENLFLNLPDIESLSIYYYETLEAINQAYHNLNDLQRASFNIEKYLLLQEYNNKMNKELIPEYRLREEEEILVIKNNIDTIIPLETKNNLNLPTRHTSSFVEFTLTWTSSSPIINSLGEITRPDFDTDVDLTVLIQGRFTNQTYTVSIKVKGLLEVDLPPLDGTKKLTFAYLRTTGVGTNLLERDYMKIDVINYAFAKIVNGELSILPLSNLNTVLRLRAKGLRVVVVIDGVSTETREAFALAASNSTNREKLANSIANIIEQYQFDGVDLDWEFPSGTTEKNNFSLLLKTIRKKLDESPRKLILSAAVISGSYSSHYDLVEMNKYIDYLHIMSYGMNSGARHSSPLIKSTYATYAINSSVNMYINGGIDRAKIVFGMPFYVKLGTLSNPNASPLGQTLSNTESLGYSNFKANYFNQQGFIEYYDPNALAYYAVSPTRFASYDNPASVTAKCNWAIENNIAGVMFWDYGHDQAGGTLLEAIYQVFKVK